MNSLIRKAKKIGKAWRPTLYQTDTILSALVKIRTPQCEAVDSVIDSVLDYRTEASRGGR